MKETTANISPPPPAESNAAFGWAYWVCNWVETLERLAFYTLRPVAAIYIMQATDPGGLRLTAMHKGVIYFWWAVFQSLLPTFTGGLADRYGYRRTLFFALSMNTVGYLIMAFFHSYHGFLTGIIVMATGTAFFKPSLQGTLAPILTRQNSSVGWGIFYFVVNIGAFIGHILSPIILLTHSQSDWRNLFLACAAFSFLNVISLIWFPDITSGASKTENPLQVFKRTVVNVFEPRLAAWLLIMSCFWMMMYQLWDLQPNFIEDWIDSSAIAAWVPIGNWVETGPDGLLRVKQQILLNLNATMIILFVVPVSWAVRRMRTLSAMLIGMLACTAGVLVAGLTGIGGMLLAGIVLFSLGEMLTGPKKSEYLGLIAPPGKKGLYLGYVNIPTGLGQGIGAYLAGWVYNHYGEKATLALRYLVEHTQFVSGEWDGNTATLETVTGVTRPEAFARLQEVLGTTGPEVTRILWETYHPQYAVWIPFACIGAVAAIALAIFGRMAKRWSDMNA
jgi:MFS family permease